MSKTLDLAEIREELRTQDNLFCAHPLYTVQEKKRTHGFDPLFTEHGETVWIDIENGCEEVDLEKMGISEADAEEKGYLQETGFQDKWEFVNAHFTYKAAEEYIKKFSHRHKGDLTVFVSSMHNSPEMIAIRKALLEGQLFQLDWKDASEKPEKTKHTYLYGFKNDNGNNVTLMALYFGPNELELDYDTEPFEGCTCPNDDEYYCPAGWYECGYEQEFAIRLPQDGKWCEFPRYVEAENE